MAVRLTHWTGAWQQKERGGPAKAIAAVHGRGRGGKHSFLRRDCAGTMDEGVLLYEGGQWLVLEDRIKTGLQRH